MAVCCDLGWSIINLNYSKDINVLLNQRIQLAWSCVLVRLLYTKIFCSSNVFDIIDIIWTIAVGCYVHNK